MKMISYTMVLVIFCVCYPQAQQDVLTRISSSKELMPYATGYINSSGDTIIPIGKYTYCFTERFDKIAIVSLNKGSGFCAIDRNEKVLFEVLVMDNGPDYVKDGLFRIRKNGKVGYANMNGEIVIKPQFDFAFPFKNGFAIVGFGGKDEIENEHKIRVGGKYGFINISGEYVIQPIYDDARYCKEKGKAKVKKGGAWIILNSE